MASIPSSEMDDCPDPMLKAFSAVTEDNEFEAWQNQVGSNPFIGDMQRIMYPGGMERSSSKDKIDYLLVRDGPMYERWAAHLSEGAKRHEPRNWMLASSVEEEIRFQESAARHFEAWLRGDDDEDHAAAVFFNINGFEYTANKVNELMNVDW